MFVPPNTPVKRNRAHNVDTDRLRLRRAFLLVQFADRVFDSRMEHAVRAYELQAIENVLVIRGALAHSDRRTAVGNLRRAA